MSSIGDDSFIFVCLICSCFAQIPRGKGEQNDVDGIEGEEEGVMAVEEIVRTLDHLDPAQWLGVWVRLPAASSSSATSATATASVTANKNKVQV